MACFDQYQTGIEWGKSEFLKVSHFSLVFCLLTFIYINIAVGGNFVLV
jgi:hypothetical protein